MNQHNYVNQEQSPRTSDRATPDIQDTHTDAINLGKLRKSNTLFRRAALNDDEISIDSCAPVGKLVVENMHFHPNEFAAFAIRSVAYAQETDHDDPLDCFDHGVIRINGRTISWKIELETSCGTLKSAPNADPLTIARNVTITLPTI